MFCRLEEIDRSPSYTYEIGRLELDVLFRLSARLRSQNIRGVIATVRTVR